jgi:hypothetical protein
MEGEDREQRAWLAAADVKGAPVDAHLERSENADVHLCSSARAYAGEIGRSTGR